jgi:GST-like protein
VFESGAILLYLAEKTGKFLARDVAQKYSAIQWLMLQMASVGPMFGQLNHFRNFKDGNEYAYKRYKNEVLRLFAVLDKHLAETSYLAGDHYSVADIATYPWALYHEQYKFDWAEHPHVKRWCDTISARPAIQRGITAISKIEPADQKAFTEAPPAEMDRFFNRTWLSKN